MIDSFLNQIRAHAQMAQGDKTTHRVGQITAYDPSKYAVKVKFWPDTTDSTGWIPLLSTFIGAGWGLVAAPSIGDQVMVAFDREDQDAGVVVGRFFTDVEQPPAAPSGEFWLVHKSGNYLKFTNDGNVSLNVTGNLSATVGGNMTANVTGNSNTNAAQANVTATSSASVTAPTIKLGANGQTLLQFVTSAFVNLFNTHTHPEHDGGSTQAPNQTMGSSHLTSTITGG
ncbi:phage baseplate assembly protein V [Paraburkholderia phymatum]|uniref:Phage baseplate assembly protein V n=1 Tax=Paraburkholderia phymatum TaxID=148447 RepID=A0ACC6U0W8_9BURK